MWQGCVVLEPRGDYTSGFNRYLLEPVGVECCARAGRKCLLMRCTRCFSDDVNWCMLELVGVLKGRMLFVDETDGLTSLILMMLADYHVIANSTLSWRTAFLIEKKGKVIVAPKAFGLGRELRRKLGFILKRGLRCVRGEDKVWMSQRQLLTTSAQNLRCRGLFLRQFRNHADTKVHRQCDFATQSAFSLHAFRGFDMRNRSPPWASLRLRPSPRFPFVLVP